MKDQSHQPRMQGRKTAYAYGRSAQERFGLLVLGLDPRKDGTGLFVRMELNESDDQQSPCPAMKIGYAYDGEAFLANSGLGGRESQRQSRAYNLVRSSGGRLNSPVVQLCHICQHS